MQISRFLIASLLSIAVANGQVGRIELITRSAAHPARKGSTVDTGAPEISQDGRFVLFLGGVANVFTTNSPNSVVPNLFLMDRQTRDVELVSVGADGLPANEPVVNFQFSANNRRVMFETRASNIVTNDSNGATDVFVRDLDLRKTLLVSVNATNAAARGGGSDASMSADGNRVLFWNNSSELNTGPYGTYVLRDLIAGTNAVLTNLLLFVQSRDGSISDEGRIAVFSTGLSFPTLVATVYDARINKTTTVGDPSGTKFAPIVSADGRYVFYDTTNKIVRFNVATGLREEVITDDAERPQPVAASYDGTTLLLFAGGGAIWKEGSGLRSLPPVPVNEAGLDPVRTMELSRDGNFVAFVADAPADRVGSRTGRQLYFYDIEANSLSKISPDNDGLGIEDETPPDPSISGDASVVVFSAASEVIDADGSRDAVKLFTWERASGNAELLTTSEGNQFENTVAGDSNISEHDAISEDGSRIVYASTWGPGWPASNADTNQTWDVFMLDRTTGSLGVLSLRPDGMTGNGASYRPIISGNGQFVAFLSAATNLLPNPGPMLGLYVFDLQTGVLKLITELQGPNAKAKAGVPYWYTFSRDGRYFAFTTSESLDPRDTNAFWDVYVYDTTTGTTTLISYSADEASAGNGDSTFPTISPDGKYVAFRSLATNLGISNTGSKPPPVFVRTLETGLLRKPAQAQIVGQIEGTPIQVDRASTRIVFKENLSTFTSFDLNSAAVANVCSNCLDAAVSENGQWAAFLARDSSRPRNRPVVLKDLVRGVETPLMATNQFCHYPRIATNGDFVVFECAGPLATNDVNGTTDIYLFSRVNGTTNLISARAGRAANGPSLRPMLSADQSFILFRSMASDLVANDLNEAADLFLAYLPGLDSDHDQLDDAWELAKFGSLDRDGAADSDADGLSDLQEFLAGTEPKFSVSSVRLGLRMEGSGIRVGWFAVPGRTYRVQGSADLNGGWHDVASPVVAAGDMDLLLSKPDAGATFYFRLLVE